MPGIAEGGWRPGAYQMSFSRIPSTTTSRLLSRGTYGRAIALPAGGGASQLVDHLIEAGFTDLSVLDIAPPALDAARRRLGPDANRVTWITTDLLTWKPERRYHLWHDRAVFHFLTTPGQRDRYLAVLRDALIPGGQAIVGTFAADRPRTCSGLPVARYSPKELADQFPGFITRATRSEQHRTPHGAVQPFTWLLVVRFTR
jgi:trans-aconitate methyltransferase